MQGKITKSTFFSLYFMEYLNLCLAVIYSCPWISDSFDSLVLLIKVVSTRAIFMRLTSHKKFIIR